MTFFGICKQCNHNFQKNSNVQIFCSESCKNKYNKENPKPLKVFDKICENCKREFVTNRLNSRFCSCKCSSNLNAKIGRIGGNRVGLDNLISLYGEKEGNKRYEIFKTKISISSKNRISGHSGKKHSSVSKKLIAESVKNSKYHKELKGKKLPKEEVDKRIKNGKGVFTLNWFIKKYGEKDGVLKYQERSKVVSEKSHFKIYNRLKNKNNYSKISQNLFWSLYNRLQDLHKEKVYFGELNHEYSCGLPCTCYDFVALDRKKIIKFNGSKFHANPDRYKSTDFPNPYTKITAKEILESDKNKIDKAIKKGYKVLIVWDYDFKYSKELVIQKCIDFLKE